MGEKLHHEIIVVRKDGWVLMQEKFSVREYMLTINNGKFDWITYGKYRTKDQLTVYLDRLIKKYTELKLCA